MASSRKRGPADLIGHVREVLLEHVRPGARLCLGYSGGLDSSVLLHVLVGLAPEIGFSLAVVHVHHGLSAKADDWAEFCRNRCERHGVPLVIRRVRVTTAGEGIEAAARAARYQAFAEQEADFIVLAHQRDDQAETLLLRLLRGAGTRGLGSMAVERPLGGSTRVLRPLLDLPRQALADYAAARGIDHIDDDSNADQGLDRNWLRQAVLPQLAGRFPACGRVLARNAAQLGEDAALLDQLARIDLAGVMTPEGLNLDALGRLDEARARNLMRYWLAETAGVVPSRARLLDILHQLLHARPDRWPEWRLDRWVLRRQHGHALLSAPAEPTDGDADETWLWRGETELVLGGHGRLLFTEVEGQGIAAACLPREGAWVGWRRGGERLRPDCARPRRTLKNLLREGGLAPRARLRLPLLQAGGRLVWVAGVGIECGCQAGPGEPGWLIEWRPSGPAGR